MLAPVVHILPLTTIQRERKLSVPGQVNVRLSQKVNASEVIAETKLPREHALIDVARRLGISSQAADRLIQCKTGDNLISGATVAIGDGLIPRHVTAPKDGRVVAVGGGQILLEVSAAFIEVKAGFPGVVTELIPERGAIIQSSGALIQGVWGNNRTDSGMLISLLEDPAGVLTASRLDVSLRGSILLAGACRDAEVLKAAAELPVRGMIFSNIHPGLLPLAAQMRYPIIVLDGFVKRAMNTPAYKLLSTNVKREITLSTETFNRYTGARPEIFIGLPVTQAPPEPKTIVAFAAEQQVRICRMPHAGATGTLVKLLPGQTVLPNGLRAQAAEVRLENGDQIVVPLVNLEVLG